MITFSKQLRKLWSCRFINGECNDGVVLPFNRRSSMRRSNSKLSIAGSGGVVSSASASDLLGTKAKEKLSCTHVRVGPAPNTAFGSAAWANSSLLFSTCKQKQNVIGKWRTELESTAIERKKSCFTTRYYHRLLCLVKFFMPFVFLCNFSGFYRRSS